MSNQLQVSGEAKIRAIQGPVVANSGVITALDGDASEYVRGDGTLADFPTSTGGGSSVSYYLNTSVSQGTIGGVAYKQLSKVPISGAGTDVTISANGYIASYITDANDPALLEVPAGNFNCEFYFSVNSNAHNPYVYAEVYKYDGTTFTLLGSNVSIPQYLSNGTTLSPYYFAIAVSTAVLTVTDRIAIRIYVNVDTRTVTLHTENNHLCQVVTTFSKGLISLNNLTRQNQFFATGTSGTDFAISSATATHTFNLPVASAANTGKLSSTDWSTFNGKVPYTGATANVDLGIYSITAGIGTFTNGVLNGNGTNPANLYLKKGSSPFFTNAANYGLIAAVSSSFILISDVDGTNYKYASFNLGSLTNNTNRAYTLPNASGTIALTSDLTGFVTSVTGTSPIVSSGGTTPAISIPVATTSVNGYLSSADWTTFNSKESVLTFSSPLVRTTNTISIPAATTSVNGYLTSTDWTTFNSKQGTITLTTTGSSGAATFVSNTLNIPNYGSALSGYIPYTGTGISVYGLSAIGEYDGGAQIPAGYGGNYALTLGNGAIGNGLSLYTTGYIDAGAIRTAGFSRVTNATASTSTTTGAFVVTGGVGIGGALYGTSIILSGTIGIGTSSPSSKLDVRGSSPQLRVGIAGGGYVEVSDNQVSAKNTSNAASDLYLNVSGANTILNRDSGNVGIGSSTFTFAATGRTNLVLNGSTDSLFEFQNGGSSRAYLYSNTNGLEINSVGSRFLQFVTNAEIRMRITSDGTLRLTRSSGTVDFTVFQTGGGDNFCDVSANAFRTNTHLPINDNTSPLGSSGSRWTVVYATTGTINTSDYNDKEQIEDLTESEKNVAIKLKSIIKKFKFKDAVVLKGDNARIHIGIIAQEVENVFIEEGLDANKYGLFCADTTWELDGVSVEKDTEGAIEKTKLGIRYEELITFIISQI